MRPVRWLLLFSLSVLSVFGQSTPPSPAQRPPNPQDQQPGPPGTIRVRVRLIPVDVIVTDMRDNPVTDLKPTDFQVFENGQRQEIKHFSAQKFDAPIMAARPQPAPTPGPDLTPQTARTFLIVMGRGRHQTPLKAVDAIVRFVRNDLLPQDRIAVFAYNSATDFTTDHARVAGVLERYKQANDKIESWLELRFRGLATVYGIRDLPKALQVDIDKIFLSPGVSTRQVPPGRITEKGKVVRDWDRALDTMLKDTDKAVEMDVRQAVADQVAEEGGPGSLIMQNLIKFDSIDSGFITVALPFDQFAPLAAGSFQDLQNLYTCIEYMRYIEGEKHLLFFSSEGLLFPNGNVDYERGLITMANDARVSISTFQTGGLFADPNMLPTIGVILPPVPKGSTTTSAPPPTEIPTTAWSKTAMSEAMSSVAQYTGGRSAVVDTIPTALENLNRITRFEYLLGYYPSDDRWDGKYRRISVKVDRPDTKISFRRGYYARDTLRPYDREEFLSFSRISAAGSYESDINDIPFRYASSKTGDPPQMKVDLQVDAEKIGFKMVDLRHVGRLRCAVFFGDEAGNSLGNSWVNLNLDLPEEKYQEYLHTGIPLTVMVPWKDSGKRMKIIVYDPIGDRIGSKVTKIH